MRERGCAKHFGAIANNVRNCAMLNRSQALRGQFCKTHNCTSALILVNIEATHLLQYRLTTLFNENQGPNNSSFFAFS